MATNRILIIEDDAELCSEMMEALEYEGYAVQWAEDSVKGENLIRNGNFDVTLLDYKMPLSTGVDILKNLKADHVRKCIFIVSGRPSTERALKEEGVFDMVCEIIPKPIDFEDLLKKIHNCCKV